MTPDPFERRWKRRKRWGPISKFAVLSLGLLLILSEACSPSFAGDSRWSPARKARFFNTGGSPIPPSEQGSNDHQMGNYRQNCSSDLYEDEKRRVHTGPNPLHN